MLIPLGTDRPLRRPAVLTPALVVCTVLAHLALEALAAIDPTLHDRVLASLWIVGGEGFRPWALVTSAFVHGGFLHLLGNMLFLWVFGPCVEDRFGRGGFLAFYLLAAAASGGLHAAFERVSAIDALSPEQVALLGEAGRSQLAALPPVYVPAVGASGAIAAITGAFLVLFPMTHVRVFVFFFFIGRWAMPAWWFIGFQLFWNFLGQARGGGDVAYLAHLGGYAFGVGLSALLLALGVFPREPYDLFTLGRQAHRRRQFREAHAGAAHERDRAARRLARAEPDPRADRAAAARLVVANRLDLSDGPGAAEAYLRLLSEFGAEPARVTLSPARQNQVADELFRAADHANAAAAYKLYLDAYGDQPGVARVRLMLGIIYARYLNSPIDACPLLRLAAHDVALGDDRELAQQILEELGCERE